MTLKEQSKQFITGLYLKSRSNLSGGFNAALVAKLSGLDRDAAENVQEYLHGKGLIKLSNYKGDPNVYLTANGVDQAESAFEGKEIRFMKFEQARHVPNSTGRAVAQFVFFYTITDENGQSSRYRMLVTISDVLCLNWGYPFWSSNPSEDFPGLIKILSQYVKDRVIEKLKEGTLSESEELLMMSTSYPEKPDYDPENVVDPIDAEYVIQLGNKSIGQEIKDNKLAAAIIETRDAINAIFDAKNNAKLLKLDEERNLLDFFKHASTEEEFVHRMASLAQVSRNLNLVKLRELTGTQDNEIRSVQLLKIFLEQNGKSNPLVTETLLNIGRIRQGYPIHSDISKVIEGLRHFSLDYPVADYNLAWEVILNRYADALKALLQILLDLYYTKS
jgi:hypothetical protein